MTQPNWQPQQPAPYGTPPYAAPPKKSKAPLWIGLGCLGLLVLTGVAFLILLIIGAKVANDNGITGASSPADSAAESSTIIVDEGSVITQTGSTASSKCFSFQIPEQYLLNPQSEMCQAMVNVQSSDSLTSVQVMVQTGAGTIEEAKAAAEKALGDKTMFEVKSIDTIVTTSGFDALDIKYTSSGLASRMYVIPGMGRTWTIGGVKAESILIMGYDLDTKPSPIETVANSIELMGR